MTGKQKAITERAIDLMRGYDQDKVTILAIHRVIPKGGHELSAIRAFAKVYDCELEIYEKERLLIKDIFIQITGKTSDLILFYETYSLYFGEPTG